MPTHNPQAQALLAEFQHKAAASDGGLAAQGFSPEHKELLRGLWDELQTPMFEVWLVSLQPEGGPFVRCSCKAVCDNTATGHILLIPHITGLFLAHPKILSRQAPAMPVWG